MHEAEAAGIAPKILMAADLIECLGGLPLDTAGPVAVVLL